MDCLDYFIANPKTTVAQKVKEELSSYTLKTKRMGLLFYEIPFFQTGLHKRIL